MAKIVIYVIGIFVLSGCLIFISGCDDADENVSEKIEVSSYPKKIDEAHIHNLHQLTDAVYCGGQPEDLAAFQALKKWGVKTVISVDGARPDLALAKKLGLRYVHIPIGYDQVPSERALEIAKAIQELPGKFYIHCHHGRHRGPAAAAVALVVTGDLNPKDAVAAMTAMGTAPKYEGLWTSAREAKVAGKGVLEKLNVTFVETAKIPPLAEAMVSIDITYDNLKKIKEAGWKVPKDHPDLDPPHEALQLREQFRELARSGDAIKKKAFIQILEASEKQAAELEALLRASLKKNAKDKALQSSAGALMKGLKQNCNACHKPFRNK